jgi:thiol-disulfide isomerase/thioredoxin
VRSRGFGVGGILVAAVVLALGSARGAAAQTLGIGDPAPKLQVKSWVKGQPVEAFAKGKNYVVEFWATWCGPCKATIPHLTELQKKNPNVTFIGVSILEEKQEDVRPFVDEMGAKMGYRVALDLVPAGKEGDAGIMATTWMNAAGQGGIPTAFVVDKEGRIAWIGHPMELEEPLAQIVAGKYDLNAAAAKFKTEREEEAKLEALSGRIQEAQRSGDPARILEVVEQGIRETPSLEIRLWPLKFGILMGPKGDRARGLEYGQRLVTVLLKDDPQALSRLAWGLVQPKAPKPDQKVGALALKAARRAEVLTERKVHQVLDILARALYVTGDTASAVESEERAVKLAEDPDEARDYRERLEEYRNARR